MRKPLNIFQLIPFLKLFNSAYQTINGEIFYWSGGSDALGAFIVIRIGIGAQLRRRSGWEGVVSVLGDQKEGTQRPYYSPAGWI